MSENKTFGEIAEAAGAGPCLRCVGKAVVGPEAVVPSEIAPREEVPEGCTPADAMVLREANFQLVALFNEIAKTLEMWDEGLDEQDGEDYERGVKAWDEMMTKIREYR